MLWKYVMYRNEVGNRPWYGDTIAIWPGYKMKKTCKQENMGRKKTMIRIWYNEDRMAMNEQYGDGTNKFQNEMKWTCIGNIYRNHEKTMFTMYKHWFPLHIPSNNKLFNKKRGNTNHHGDIIGT